MRGWSNKLLFVLALIACADESELPQPAPSDAGLADATEPTDAGPMDAGFSPLDSGRWMRTYRAIPAGEVDNFVLAPDFDLSLFNLGWQAGGAQGGQIQFTRRVDVRVPGIRKEWVELPGRSAAPPRTFLAGFGRAPDTRLRVDAWVGFSRSSTTTRGENVQVSLHGIAPDGQVLALLLEPTPDEEVVVGDRRWVPHRAESMGPWVGFVTVLVLNGASESVGLNAPHIRSAPIARRTGRGVDPLGIERPANEEERRILAHVWQTERARRTGRHEALRAAEAPLQSRGLGPNAF